MKKSNAIGLLFLLTSCSMPSATDTQSQNCSALFESSQPVGELRIVMINQARLGERVYISNSQCSNFEDGLQMTKGARDELAELIGVDDEGGIHAGVYLVDLNVRSTVGADNSSDVLPAGRTQVDAVNTLVDEIGFGGLATALERSS